MLCICRSKKEEEVKRKPRKSAVAAESKNVGLFLTSDTQSMSSDSDMQATIKNIVKELKLSASSGEEGVKPSPK